MFRRKRASRSPLRIPARPRPRQRPDAPAAPDAAACRVFAPERLDDFIAAPHWRLYAQVLDAAEAAGVRFCIGGGLAMFFYTGLWRPTKDIDLYVAPAQREEMIEATRRAGLVDHHAEAPYDRNWIYRASGEGVIVDVIWALANGFGEVEEGWLESAPRVALGGRTVHLLGPAEMIWTKLHVLQRDRCDWPDLLNLLHTNGDRVDWMRLLDALRGEERLLAALLTTFAWLAPGSAARIPAQVWEQLRIAPPDDCDREVDAARVQRLDSRPWFSG